ncbi:ABC transporter permease subunit [Stutzerimonas urumqiensis]|uniref:ABC transporter permease subunit n=1 Tax=Stutzerimonas urumqiensis TaxID=638269 RepID=UPI003DA2EB71
MNNLAHTSMTSEGTQRIDFNTDALRRKRRMRALKDRLTGWYVSIGGLGVLVAITLIFFYLFYEVAPLFQGATIEEREPLQAPWLQEEGERPLMLSLEEQNMVGMRLDSAGEVVFFDTKDARVISEFRLPIPQGVQIVSHGQDVPGSQRTVVGLSNGQALVFEHSYKVSFPNNVKTLTPVLEYPFGETPLTLDPQGRPLDHVGAAVNDETLILAGSTGTELHVLRLASEENMMTGEVTLEEERIGLPVVSDPVQAIFVDPRQQWLYVLNGRAAANVFDLRKQVLNGRYKLLDQADNRVTASSMLLGGVSLLIGDAKGGVGQWFMVSDPDGGERLHQVRSFELGQAPIVEIVPEERRKGFLALDETGLLGVFYTTSHRHLLSVDIAENPEALAISPRANRVMVEDGATLRSYDLDNPHPEVSWDALWGKVWYENYDEPSYIWQSTSASGDFEPKLSLSPLAFGTLKAAFYAMILAAPLAVAAALYTAYFMAPAMRRKVKPVIELMEALPTVILGFFAGLFLAPFLELHLPGIFTLLILMPLAIVGTGFGWSRLPESIRLRVPPGWESAILIPVVVFVGWFSFAISGHIEAWLFGGNMPLWLSHEMGVTFDQRNALVVGIAMGFAVIPNIYSIAEDAVFSVPKSLTFGSLALGATPWQTLTRVVILTASPGIFSALMIGMGRAVGETMIVLMATGNTPIMEANIFEGMRTLAANVAVEMPESEVGGTHFRVLFLAALVLLMFTFVMNTLAEVIRQRLRTKYSSL